MRVLSSASVDGIREPMCPEPDVHVILPPLAHIRSVTERFNKLSLGSSSSRVSNGEGSRLILSANMAGQFKMRLVNDAVKVESLWKGLNNPNMDLDQALQSTGDRPQDEFAKVTVDGKEWGKVLKVGGLAKKVIACKFPVCVRVESNGC